MFISAAFLYIIFDLIANPYISTTMTRIFPDIIDTSLLKELEGIVKIL